MIENLIQLSEIVTSSKERIFNIKDSKLDLNDNKILLLLCQNTLYTALQHKIDYTLDDYDITNDLILKNKINLLLCAIVILKIYKYDFSKYFQDSDKNFDDDQLYVVSEVINDYVGSNRTFLSSQAIYFLTSIIKNTYSRNIYKKIIADVKKIN